MKAKAIYDKINGKSGGVYASSSQGQWLRDTSQVYRQKKKESVRKEPHDDLSNVIRLQSQSCELIRTIFITCKSYQFFLATMSNYNMLNCFVAAVTVFYQLIQLSIFVTVGSLTLVITTKGW